MDWNIVLFQLAQPQYAYPRRRHLWVSGQLFSVHGGKFYEVRKYEGAPAVLPKTLHWFKGKPISPGLPVSACSRLSTT